MVMVACTGFTCKHNDGGFCKAEVIKLINKEYFDEMGEPRDDDMCCISYELDRTGRDKNDELIQAYQQLPRNSAFTRR